VQQYTDLVAWSPAIVQEEVLSTTGDLQQIRASVDPTGTDHLFLRLKVTRP
jgi:hypothetical protein